MAPIPSESDGVKIEEQRRQEFNSVRARMLSERMGKWRDEAKRDWLPMSIAT